MKMSIYQRVHVTSMVILLGLLGFICVDLLFPGIRKKDEMRYSTKSLEDHYRRSKPSGAPSFFNTRLVNLMIYSAIAGIGTVEDSTPSSDRWPQAHFVIRVEEAFKRCAKGDLIPIMYDFPHIDEPPIEIAEISPDTYQRWLAAWERQKHHYPTNHARIVFGLVNFVPSGMKFFNHAVSGISWWYVDEKTHLLINHLRDAFNGRGSGVGWKDYFGFCLTMVSSEDYRIRQSAMRDAYTFIQGANYEQHIWMLQNSESSPELKLFIEIWMEYMEEEIVKDNAKRQRY